MFVVSRNNNTQMNAPFFVERWESLVLFSFWIEEIFFILMSPNDRIRFRRHVQYQTELCENGKKWEVKPTSSGINRDNLKKNVQLTTNAIDTMKINTKVINPSGNIIFSLPISEFSEYRRY